MKVVCPKCGSGQITGDKKGFSGGKAIAGALITGGIGLLAGFHGSSKIKITCLACGNTFKPGQGEIINEPGDEKIIMPNVAQDENTEGLTDLDIPTSFEITNKGKIAAISFVN